MAKPVKCRACGGEIAKRADRCPHCGSANGTDVMFHLVRFIALIGVAGAIAYLLGLA